MKLIHATPLLLGLATSHALADTPLALSHTAAPDAHISISNVKGEVTVTAWDREQVQVGGRLGSGARPLEITGSDSDLSIKVQAQGASSWFNWNGDTSMGSTTLDVRVPRRASLKIDVVSAPASVDGLDGGSIDINSVSGRLRINARTPDLDVQSVSGSIEQAGHADRAKLQTVSGDILAPALGTEAKVQTVSGRIQIAGGPWRKLTLSTVSGDAQLGGGLDDGGSLSVDSMSGDVQLQLPSSLSANLHASTFSGDMRSDFGSPKENEHGPGSELNATAGNGNGKISLETFSGDLRIRKGD